MSGQIFTRVSGNQVRATGMPLVLQIGTTPPQLIRQVSELERPRSSLLTLLPSFSAYTLLHLNAVQSFHWTLNLRIW